VNILKRRSGFTLFELLIVMAIIGLLLAFLVPNLLGATTHSVHVQEMIFLHRDL